MRIALASPRVAESLDDGLDKVTRFQRDAAAAGASIVCFPEAYLPGLRGVDIEVLPFDKEDLEDVLVTVSESSRESGIATILGTERITTAGRQIAAVVFDKTGDIVGWQTKNQIAPSEDPHYIPGNSRCLFEIDGVKFGIAICHEGWRYPETVRWAATRGAKIIFHPQHSGSDMKGPQLSRFGSSDATYYEKAMVMRSNENMIYFASVNYGLRFQESATCIIDPDGNCQAQLPYGREGLLVETLDLNKATGLLAMRFAPERYGEELR